MKYLNLPTLLSMLLLPLLQANAQDASTVDDCKIVPHEEVGLSDTLSYIVFSSGEILPVKESTFMSQNNMGTFTRLDGDEEDIDMLFVFALYDDLGNEMILYHPDSLETNIFTKEEMRCYVRGELDAMNEQNGWTSFSIAAAIGAGSIYAMDEFVGGGGWALLTQAATIFVMGAFAPDPEDVMADKPAMRHNLPYLLGYSDKTQSIRNNMAIYGSLAGLIVGGVILFVTD